MTSSLASPVARIVNSIEYASIDPCSRCHQQSYFSEGNADPSTHPTVRPTFMERSKSEMKREREFATWGVDDATSGYISLCFSKRQSTLVLRARRARFGQFRSAAEKVQLVLDHFPRRLDDQPAESQKYNKVHIARHLLSYREPEVSWTRTIDGDIRRTTPSDHC